MSDDTTGGAVNLADLDDQYAQVTPAEGGSEVPDGTYQVAVAKVELKESTKGNRMLSWQLRVIAGQHDGRVIFKQNMLETPDNLRFLKADLGICGLELGRLSDLPQALPQLLDLQLVIQKKTNGEFMNVYFRRRISVDLAAAGMAGPAAGGGKPAGLPKF